jgi:hypothetical protein
MTIGAYNAVRVGDLEIAMVLARELRPLGGRPSLTLGQLQQAFGASRLDGPARERIDAALGAAGMHADPSVLEAHPDEPLAFAFAGGGPAPTGLARRRFERRLAGGAAPLPRARTSDTPAPEAPAPEAPELPALEPESQPAAPSAPVAAVLAGVALPVLLASVAGWRFGLAFAGLGAIAAGFLLSRPDPGLLLRSGRTFLLAIAGLCLLSLLGAAVLVGGAGH